MKNPFRMTAESRFTERVHLVVCVVCACASCCVCFVCVCVCVCVCVYVCMCLHENLFMCEKDLI